MVEPRGWRAEPRTQRNTPTEWGWSLIRVLVPCALLDARIIVDQCHLHAS